MITLETFKKCVKAIQHQDEIDKQLTDLLIGSECSGWVTTGEELINSMRALLKDSINDQYDYIDWWLYDVGKGNRKVYERKKNEFCDEVQLIYDLEDLDSLYYYILGEYYNVPTTVAPFKEQEDKPHEYNTCSLDEFFKQAGMPFDEVNHNDNK